MKVQERRHIGQGMGGGYWEVRVITINAKDKTPEQTELDKDAQEFDWRKDQNQEAS